MILRSRYAYTLDLAGKPGKDPLAYFLFQKRAGHLRILRIGDGSDVAHAGNPFARN